MNVDQSQNGQSRLSAKIPTIVLKKKAPLSLLPQGHDNSNAAIVPRNSLSPQNRRERSLRPGKNGNIPPVEYRWKAGQSGNPGGRPKILREESASFLAEKVDGKTNARRLIESMAETALSDRKDKTSAYRELRQTAESEATESDKSGGGLGGDNLVRLMDAITKILPRTEEEKRRALDI